MKYSLHDFSALTFRRSGNGEPTFKRQYVRSIYMCAREEKRVTNRLLTRRGTASRFFAYVLFTRGSPRARRYRLLHCRRDKSFLQSIRPWRDAPEENETRIFHNVKRINDITIPCGIYARAYEAERGERQQWITIIFVSSSAAVHPCTASDGVEDE